MVRVAGVDCSTNSVAYGVVEDGKLIDYGEIMFVGSDINKRLLDARKKIEANLDKFDVDFIVFEKAINVRNIDVAIKMAEFFGMVKSFIMEGSELWQMTPIAWQNHIGNPALRGKDKLAWCKAHPEYKTKSQIDAGIRKYRKQVTMDWVEEKFGVKAENDNISDAIAIAATGYDKLVANG